MPEKMFMRVQEVAETLDVSIPYAYKLIRAMNAELKQAMSDHSGANRPEVLPRPLLRDESERR